MSEYEYEPSREGIVTSEGTTLYLKNLADLLAAGGAQSQLQAAGLPITGDVGEAVSNYLVEQGFGPTLVRPGPTGQEEYFGGLPGIVVGARVECL